VSGQDRALYLTQVAEAPSLLRAAVANLSDAQLDTPYRTGGWTVRQVVHHLADSHLNWYVRAKLALTEQEPTIQPSMKIYGPNCKMAARMILNRRSGFWKASTPHRAVL